MNLKNLETINFELRNDGVGLITLNRPERLNAMSFQFTEDFNTILDYLMIQIDLSRELLFIKKCNLNSPANNIYRYLIYVYLLI